MSVIWDLTKAYFAHKVPKTDRQRGRREREPVAPCTLTWTAQLSYPWTGFAALFMTQVLATATSFSDILPFSSGYNGPAICVDLMRTSGTLQIRQHSSCQQILNIMPIPSSVSYMAALRLVCLWEIQTFNLPNIRSKILKIPSVWQSTYTFWYNQSLPLYR